jgi:MFS transporter, DHA2 family, methylenomycin A resistance protein
MTTAETSASPVGTDGAHRWRHARGGVKITALATGFVMATLDITVVNVAGATLEQRLDATLTQLTWIVDGYVLTFCSLLMLAGGLANRLGAKRIYMWGMGLFFLASLACALSPSAEILIAARLIQGASAALFMPSSLSLLVFSFPERRHRTRMLGLWSAIVASSAGLGPVVGGVMVNTFGWQSIFLLNLPIGAIGMIMTHRYIAPAEGRTIKLAVPGHLIWIIMLAALSFALIEGPREGWAAPLVMLSYIVVAVAALALIARERRGDKDKQVMPWGLFRLPSFAGANIVGFLFNFSLFGSIFMISLFLQNARGNSPLAAGLMLLPMTFLFPVSNVVYSRISARFTNGALLTACLLLAGLATMTMTTVTSSTPYWILALGVGVANIGAGVISPAMTAALVDVAGPENANVAGSVLNANRQIGSLVGIAVMGVVLHAIPDWDRGAAMSFLVISVIYLCGGLAAWRLIARSEAHEPAAAPEAVKT